MLPTLLFISNFKNSEYYPNLTTPNYNKNIRPILYYNRNKILFDQNF